MSRGPHAAWMAAMTTTLAWSGCRNVRDLGGLPTADGRAVLPRRLVRSDNLAGLDDHGYRAFLDYGVGRVIDLRGGIPGEPEPQQPYADEVVHRVPWIDAGRDHERDPARERTLADVYRGSLDRNTRQVGAVVRSFLTAPDGPVVVHCAAGKDRTGMAVALLLGVAGVPREHVVADYAVSETNLGILEVLAAHPGPEDMRTRVAEYARTLPATLESALDHLEEVYGGVVAYLRQACGLDVDEVAGVRRRLVDS